MASALPPILVEIQADVASLKKGLADAQNTLKGLDNSVEQTGSSMTKFMDRIKQVGATLGIAFAGTQIISFFRESITAANEASNAQERLATLLRNTNGGTEAQIQALIGQAEALEAVGVVSKDNIIVAQSQLATFDLQASTINKLTPAILDYVTAEKGAAASADDYRQMTNSLAQALNGNFASLTRVGFVLDETTKKQISSGTESERAAAIVKVLDSTYKGFNETLRDNNPLQAAINDLDKLKGDIGEALLPLIDQLSRFISDDLIPGLRAMAKWFKENYGALKVFTIIVGGAYTAFKLYKGILVTTKIATQAYTVATTLMKGQQLASIASTNGLAASMLRLNAAMRANPLGLIITALALIGAGFVYAWKRSETFREVVIKVAQVVMNGFAKLSEIAGKFFSMLGKIPGMGWAKSIGNGLDGISDKVKIASKNLMDLKSGFKGMGNISMTGDGTAGDPFAGGGKGGKGGGGLGEKEKKKLADYQKKVKDIYRDMNDVIKEANEKAEAALETRNERMAEAQERYNERVADLNERYNEQMAAAQERFNERKADLDERYLDQIDEAIKRQKEAETKATKRYGEEVIKINQEFNKKKIDLEKSLQDKLTELRANAAEKASDLTQKAAEKQAGIIQQSINRLRSAFASKTGFSVAEAFGKGATGEQILADLKNKLNAAKTLADKAGQLQGLGFSQTFIEQVVSAGPEVGSSLADSILNASPETIDELKKSFVAMETVSNTGLDALAKSMNTGANLATQELRDAYNEVAVDLKQALNEVDRELTQNMAQQQAAFDAAMAEASKTRTDKLTEAYNDMREAIAESERELQEARVKAKEALDKGMAEAQAELEKSRRKAQEELNKGLAEAQATLQKALIDAQKAYEKAIDDINASTQKKLDELKRKLAEVAALMAQLAAASASLAVASAPVYTPITPVTSSTVTTTPSTSSSTTVNVTGVNLTNPTDTANSVINAIKFGNVVVPTAPTALASKESGAIGAASIAARTQVISPPKLTAQQIAMRAR
jgi:hypothetical protein